VEGLLPNLPISRHSASLLAVMGSFLKFFTDSPYSRRSRDPNICNFVVGDPHDWPMPEVVDAVARSAVPRTRDWFAYKMSEPECQTTIANRLHSRFGIAFEAPDICLTPGAFSAIATTLRAVVGDGDEVITIVPDWPFYEPLIFAAGAIPVQVGARQPDWNLDVPAIAGAITERTRMVVINSPNNPTGKIYGSATLKALAKVLEHASKRFGHPIYLMSDESYSKVVYDGRNFVTPCAFYPNSFLIYTYGKVLLAPGLRIGYVALSPSMQAREVVRAGILVAQIAAGWAFPGAVLQYALPELEHLSIDMTQLQAKRDRMVSALKEFGYEVQVPEGTFFVLVRSPLDDDLAFAEKLSRRDVFVMPGSLAGFGGWFRISLTATEGMIEKALPGFRATMKEVTSSLSV
jgi:aspartate aminotransferase